MFGRFGFLARNATNVARGFATSAHTELEKLLCDPAVSSALKVDIKSVHQALSPNSPVLVTKKHFVSAASIFPLLGDARRRHLNDIFTKLRMAGGVCEPSDIRSINSDAASILEVVIKTTKPAISRSFSNR